MTIAGSIPEKINTMMTSKQIFGYLHAEPFRQFRIHMASGRTFDIRHPEMVKVTKSYLVIFSSVSDEPEVFDYFDTVSLLLIESISYLESPISQK